MTHDPLCLSHEAPDDYWPEQLCNCRFIAKVRADEREQAIRDCIAIAESYDAAFTAAALRALLGGEK